MLIVLAITALMIAYIFVGYPLLIVLLAKRRPQVLPTSTISRSVTAVFVAYNEAQVVAKKIQNLLAQHYPSEKLNIIIVDDCSSDNTAEVIAPFVGERLHYLKMPSRSGKAAGVNLALEHCNSDLVLLLDARQEIELNAVQHLNAWFDDARIGAVSGELMLRSSEQHFGQGIDGYWRYEKLIRKAEARWDSVPGVTGAIYMLRRSCFRPIATDTVLDDVLIPMRCIELGFRVVFDERAIAWDQPSADPAREKLRKVRTIRGNYQLWSRHPRWCLPAGHPIWWQFLSHKLLRLTAPFFALVHFICALGLALDQHRWAALYTLMLLATVALYPLSLAWPSLTRSRWLRMLTAFLALNWYNVLGFYQHFFGRHSAAWKK